MISAKKAAYLLVIAVLLLVPVVILPMTYALLAEIVVISAIIVFDALRNRMLASIALRNVVRRRSLTALVIGGLMVGTAIISASLVVGDTLDNMIVKEVTVGFGEVDFEVSAPGLEGRRYFDESLAEDLVSELGAIDDVEAVSGTVRFNAGAFDVDEGLYASSVRVSGMDAAALEGLRGLEAVDGETLLSPPAAGKAYINQDMADEVDAEVGHTITLIYQEMSLPLEVERVVKDEGLGGGPPSLFVDLDVAQAINGRDGQVNLFLISLEGVGDEGLERADAVRGDIEDVLEGYEGTGLTISSDKKDTLDTSREGISQITELFLVFSSFAIISGVVLIVNIFTMLGEERKSEMGMVRAIGMRRNCLQRVFTYEGLGYAAMASAVGTALGLAIAFAMAVAVGSMFQTNSPLIEYFTFRPISLAYAFMAGFLLTIATVYLSTRRISRLNIVRAIRNIPEPPTGRGDRRTYCTGILGITLGALLLAVGVATELQAPALSGLSIITLSLGFVLRRYLGDCKAWNIAGLLTLVQWLPFRETQILPSSFQGGIEMFIVSGVFLVTTALILVMFNSDRIIHLFTSILRVKSGYKAVILTAFSYPLKAKFRTALSIFIFGLIIFTITVLVIMTGMVSQIITTEIEDNSGGFDVLAFSTPSEEVTDLWSYVNSTGGLTAGENISTMVSLYSSPGVLLYELDNGSEERLTSLVYGFDRTFYESAEFPLASWDQTISEDEDGLWEAVQNDPALVILDSSFGEQETDFGPPMESRGFEVGDNMTLSAISGVPSNVTVAGIMEQGIIGGAFVSESLVREGFGAEAPSVFFINYVDGLDVEEQAKLMERDLIGFGFQTVAIESLAKEVVAQVENVFVLFEAFIAIGLIIGVVGLGIITIRTIHERRLEIGMMRAIGFTKRMVVVNFALENAFTTLLGVLIGVITGISIGYYLFLESFEDLGADFVIPWSSLLIIAVGVIVATLLSIYPAARGASRVAPAEVLRYD